MGLAITIASVVLFLSVYLYRVWKWLSYLIRKWRAIPIYERMEREQKGLCGNCGYDLRGTPERCPECGTVAQRGARPAQK